MHREDPLELAAYNLEDCRLVLDIFAKADLLGFAMERARLTGLAIDRQGGSVATFDHLYLPRLHRRGFVAPDVRASHESTASPGGHVLDSVPGLFRDVLSFDFRSLYPSIIRTFRVDPLGLFQPGDDAVPGFDGASFARSGAILPEMIERLHDARSKAMADKNDALSRAMGSSTRRTSLRSPSRESCADGSSRPGNRSCRADRGSAGRRSGPGIYRTAAPRAPDA